MREQKLTSLFAKMTAAMGGFTLALLSITGGAAAVQRVMTESADTDDTPGARLYVESLSHDQIKLARQVAQKDVGFSHVVKKSGIAEIVSAPVHDAQGRVDKVLLTYILSKPFSGSTTEFVKLEPARFFGTQNQFESSDWNLTLRAAKRIDVIVDTSSKQVWSIMPGYGTEYQKPKAGQSVVKRDGSVFTFTDRNFEYIEETGAIVLIGFGVQS